MKNNIKWMLLLLGTMGLMACQQAEDLETRVNDRWDKVINGKLEQAYAYFSPGYKESESLDSFRLRTQTAQIHARWKKGVFVSSECEDEQVCKVVVEIDYSYKFPKRSMGDMDVTTKITENWLKLDDTWYFVPKNK